MTAADTLVGHLPDTKEQTLQKKGAKLKADSARIVRFVGQDGNKRFLDRVAEAALEIDGGNPDFAAFGDAYDSGVYQSDVTSKERRYEDVYGNNDFTASAQDPAVKRALDEVFGDVSGEAGTETGLSENALVEVLGRSSGLPNVPSLSEQGTLASRAQDDLATLPDESTQGIRGVGEADAPIEPII